MPHGSASGVPSRLRSNERRSAVTDSAGWRALRPRQFTEMPTTTSRSTRRHKRRARRCPNSLVTSGSDRTGSPRADDGSPDAPDLPFWLEGHPRTLGWRGVAAPEWPCPAPRLVDAGQPGVRWCIMRRPGGLRRCRIAHHLGRSVVTWNEEALRRLMEDSEKLWNARDRDGWEQLWRTAVPGEHVLESPVGSEPERGFAAARGRSGTRPSQSRSTRDT